MDAFFGGLKALRKNRRFFSAWFFTFALLMSASYALGVTPTAISELGDSVVAIFVPNDPIQPIALRAYRTAKSSDPRIIIPRIGVDSVIIEPRNRDIEVLNNALARGVVHYPGSASPGQTGNVLLFGHSTGLRVVQNKAYEIFNRISEVRKGEIIRIQQNGREYWYQVIGVSVKHADAAIIDLTSDKSRRLLTISTCRVFGAVDDRYVVEAEFVRSYPLRD